MDLRGWSWENSVYNGIRQFHQAKGFDPDSLDVARELGYPLMKILKEPDGPFAHVEEIWESDHRSNLQKFPDNEPLQEAAHEGSGPKLSSIEKGAPPVNNPAVADLPNHWKIIIGVQFALIVTLGALWLCDRFHS
ncbi:hypothetical protein B0H17DRAFT_1122512, partial [Mycena rosella]